MTKAYCINCGELKKKPLVKCKACNFIPKEKIDLVKSVWLSSDRCLTEKDLETENYPSEIELAEFAKLVKMGNKDFYPDNEVKILIKQFDSVSEVSWFKVIMVGLPFIIIPLIALVLYVYKNF